MMWYRFFIAGCTCAGAMLARRFGESKGKARRQAALAIACLILFEAVVIYSFHEFHVI